MKDRFLPKGLGALFFILVLHIAKAQSPDTSTVMLEPIVVTASQPLTAADPVSYAEITRKEIAASYQGQEPVMILDRLPSVNWYADAGNAQGYAYFRLRGMDQTRVNMTLDGVPLNEPEDQGVYFNNFPDFLSAVQQVQVQRGVGLSKNGTASYAGSMDFTGPDLYGAGGKRFEAGFGSFGTYRAMAEYRSGLQGNKGLYLRGSHVQGDGYKDHSGHSGQSLFFSTGWQQASTGWKLTAFAGTQANDMAWIGVPPDQVNADPRTNANSRFEDDRFSQAMLILANTRELSEQSQLRSGVYYSFLRGNYDFDLYNFLGLAPGAEVYNYAFQSHFPGFYTQWLYRGDQVRLAAGLHGNLYARRHNGSERSLGELYQNTGYKQESSAFAKAELPLGNKLKLLADMQLRQVGFQYNGSLAMEDLSWTFFNLRAGLSYAPEGLWEFYYSIGSTGREPTRNDLFGGNDDPLEGNPGEVFLFINQPERVVDQELGMRFRGKRGYLDLNAFYMDFNREIVLNGQFGPNGLALSDDVERSYRRGLELVGGLQLSDSWSIRHASSYNHTRIEEFGISFSHVLTPRWKLFQEVRWEANGWDVALNYQYQGVQLSDLANTTEISGFGLLNAQVAYQWQKLSAHVQVNNLLDEQVLRSGYVDYAGVTRYFVGTPLSYQVMLRMELP